MLKPDTLLHLSPEAVIREAHASRLYIEIGGNGFRYGQNALAILSAFHLPKRFDEGLKALLGADQGRLHRMQLSSAILHMAEQGILLPGERPEPLAPRIQDRSSYNQPHLNNAMMRDAARMRTMLAAVRQTVRPGDVVVEIGTGIGINAIEAVRAGAEHVYAIELADVGQVAPIIFHQNDVADRITYLHGDAQKVNLPERARVLICDVSSWNPMDKSAFVIARSGYRLLQENPVTIPGRMQVYAVPVEMPEEKAAMHLFTRPHLDAWKAAYGMDFSALEAFNHRRRLITSVQAPEVKGWRPLAEPTLIGTFDVGKRQIPPDEAFFTARATRSGRLTGILLYLRVFYGADLVVDNYPFDTDRPIVWHSPVFLDLEPAAIAEGDAIGMRYRYFDDGRDTFIRGERSKNGFYIEYVRP